MKSDGGLEDRFKKACLSLERCAVSVFPQASLAEKRGHPSWTCVQPIRYHLPAGVYAVPLPCMLQKHESVIKGSLRTHSACII